MSSPTRDAPAHARRETAIPTAVSPSADNRHGFQNAFIARAKAEWESAIDTVPELICLLDRKHRIVRINRSIERWGFAPLRAALGSHIHRVMHPHCTGRNCGLAQAFRQLWPQLNDQGAAKMHLEDARLGKVLALDMRIVNTAECAGMRGQRYALLVISDVTELTQAQQSLNLLNEQLETRVLERTRELENANEVLRSEIARRVTAEAALCQSRNELSHLSVQLMRAQECERKRLAMELHDSVGQSLSATKYTLEHAVQLVRGFRAAECEPRLMLAVEQVQHLIGEVRAISTGLRPVVLDDLGVASAVRGFCREWARVYQNIDLAVRIEIEDADVPESLRIGLFRAVQEALNNAAKHSGAAHVGVSIARDQDLLTVEVTDDGRGFDLSRRAAGMPAGLGLRGLRERADHSGGRLTVQSAAGKGTKLCITWLLPTAIADSKAIT